MLTQYDEQTDEDRRQRSHAELQRPALLDQFAILAGESVGTDALVAQSRLLVYTGAVVEAGQVQALVLVHAVLVVGGHDPALAATARDKNEGKADQIYVRRKGDICIYRVFFK